MYEHVCSALDQFETQRLEYLDYVYIEYQIDLLLIIVFTKAGKENQYYMVSIFGNTSRSPIRSSQDYFERICQCLPIEPYEQLSHHAIIGEREEGRRYRDSAREIVEMILREDS
jgi:hypothetical protein